MEEAFGMVIAFRKHFVRVQSLAAAWNREKLVRFWGVGGVPLYFLIVK